MGSEASEQKSENVKTCEMPMPTSTLIFIVIGCIKIKHNIRNMVLKLVSSAYKADTAMIPIKKFTEAPKYVKMHFIAKNSHNPPEIT